MNEIKLVRRPQTITPFGVGAILDIEGESFVAADVSRWGNKGEIIKEPRLERLLQVKEFRMAPPSPEFFYQINENSPGVPYVRFPRWMFCSQCRRLIRKWSQKEPPVCEYCRNRPKLVPMRFVMACPRGHLDDVPWDYWAHSLSRKKCEKSDLRFETLAGGSGLEYLLVRCESCNSRRSLFGIATPDSLKELGIKCTGRHPWNPSTENDICDAVPQVLQRGATNLTFALIESSIDIPPYSLFEDYSSETTRVTTHSLYPALKAAYQNNQEQMIDFCLEQISRETELPVKDVRTILLQDLRESSDERIPNREISFSDVQTLLAEEYLALTATGINYDSRDRFIKRDVDFASYPETAVSSEYKDAVSELKNGLSQLVQITRLREVRALRAFSRLGPPDTGEDPDLETSLKFSLYGQKSKISPVAIPADLERLSRKERFLPAIEVFGEGIFISLDDSLLNNWEQDDNVERRVARLAIRRNRNARYLPMPTPRLVLLHTLSHLLIRELSFECGYSIASMRERIYSSQPEDQSSMSGIMIYTAAGDAEGTLGGLVRQGEPDRLFPVLIRAIQNAMWCSSDPLCRESNGQGYLSLNLAACHACSLLPETSCTLSNRLLDRVLLVGSLDGSLPGYFSSLIDVIYQKGFDTLITGE